jgi:hypothetical protein
VNTPRLVHERRERPRRCRRDQSAKKTSEVTEELEAAVALVHQYVPPSPDLMQVVMNAGPPSTSNGNRSVSDEDSNERQRHA